MKLLLLSLICLLNFRAFTQSYTVLYERQYWDPTYKTLIKRTDDELTVKDSIAYFYTLFNGREAKLPLGSKFVSHALYMDLRHNTKLRQSFPFSRRKFLIIDTIAHQEWNVYDETKTVEGYLCQRATAIHNDRVIIAWFAPALPGCFGPDGLSGLPGLILEVNYAGTTNRVVAKKVALSAKPMVSPTDGRPVSPIEFTNFMDKNRPPSFRVSIH